MLFLLPAATPAPSPTIDLEDPWVVSPGIEGFIMFAILGVVLWLLIKSMTGHIRKANYRAAEREEELYGPDPEADVRSREGRSDGSDRHVERPVQPGTTTGTTGPEAAGKTERPARSEN